MTEFYAKARLQTTYGDFDIYSFKDDKLEHAALVKEYEGEPVLVRIHSQCLTGDVFSSLRCDCGEQLKFALDIISKIGGVFIYLAQEGRGIGLANKIKAYSLQENGIDTVEANLSLGFRPDERDYKAAAFILRYFDINFVALLTNNPEKIMALQKEKFKVKRMALVVEKKLYNKDYITTKEKKLGHLISNSKVLLTKEEIIEKYRKVIKKMQKKEEIKQNKMRIKV